MVCLYNLRSVEAEEGRGAGVVIVVGGAGVKKKDCQIISALSSSPSFVRVAIVLSAAATWTIILVVRAADLAAVLVCGQRGRR